VTCIVGLAWPDGSVYVGADSIATWPGMDAKDIVANSKLLRRRRWVLGIAGAWRLADVLRRHWRPEAPAGGQDDGPMLAESLKQACRAAQWRGAWEVVIGGGGVVWHCSDGYWCSQPRCGYSVAGTGGDLAHGALYALHQTRKRQRRPDPQLWVRTALAAAEAHSASVAKPFRVWRG